MKNTLHLLIVFFAFFTFSIIGQTTQTVRGTVMDSESKFPLPGVNVILISDTTVRLGAATSSNGQFKIEGVPLGRQQLKISFIGYNTQVITVQVTSGKEVVLNIEIEESSELMQEFKVVANENKEVSNEMAVVSAQQFSVEETERYAGSRGDPARMASNFAGIQGTDDSRNDIVIRGNSPLGVVYRIEGVDIPNPSHFAITGSSGGPTSMLNNKLLANSDFFTSAFPAEFGNSTAGIFDLKLRSGNNQKREQQIQFGVLGAELLAEGPFKKGKNASYLLIYRYSTLRMFQAAGIDIGTTATPQYQDLSFKMNFPLKDGSNISVWGLGGNSKIDIMVSTQKDTSIVDLYGENDRDQYFRTSMAVGGVTYTKTINEKLYFKSTLSGARDRQESVHNLVGRRIENGEFVVDSIYNLMRYYYNNYKVSNASSLNYKIGKKDVLKFGYNLDYFITSYQDSILKNDTIKDDYRVRWNSNENFMLAQAYVMWKHKFTDKMIMTTGLHAQYFSLSNAMSLFEPRIGFRYIINPKSEMAFGLGRHSQTQPYYNHFYIRAGNTVPHNKQMGFTFSNHAVLSYTRRWSKKVGTKIETYYQSLSNIPIESSPSSFSLINQGSGFARFFPDSTLVNEGTGYNYGVEFTLNKYFSDKWHAMITGAVFQSKYKGSDGIERNTDYNGNYAANLLVGREFEFNDKHSLLVGGKVTVAGGRRYGLVDTLRTQQQREVVFLDEQYNEFQFKTYFRTDLKLTYRINAKKVTHEISLDIVNLTDRQNILGITYVPIDGSTSPFREQYQLGFLPIFFYRLDF
jgi:hypothetical protein